MKCYDETPISIHKFLPIVSLGNEEDKNIPWGSCVPDENGNYYYTSFSPAGFVLPYLFIKVFHLPINIYSLYAFNCILCVSTLILITIIFCKIFSKYINKELIILCTALIYLFQMEIMHSQGVIYWVQSVMQLLIALQFLLFMNYKNKKAKIAFYFMCLIMPYVEWTGYVSNVIFALILFIKQITKDKKLTLKCFIAPFIIGILTILSFGIFSAHFLLNLNLKNYITALKNRFFARNLTSSNGKLTNLLKGYFISYKYMIGLCTILLITIISVKKYRETCWKIIKENKYVLIFFIGILIENIIMLQHATQYTFDRLKFVYILITVFFIILSTINLCNKENKFFINFIILTLILISVLNIRNYKIGYGNYIKKNNWENQNKILATYIKENFNYSNSIMCNGKNVRGYLNLLFERGIYEGKNYKSAEKITIDHHKQYLVYINVNDISKIDKVIIKDVNNNLEYNVYVKDGQLIKTLK